MSAATAPAGNAVPLINSLDPSTPLDPTAFAQSITKKYHEERDKRVRPEGNSQYVNLDTSSRFQDDPWLKPATLEASKDVLADGSLYKYLVLGAGFGGILSTVRLIQSGVPAEEIRIVDSAGGFGGTWYWNRYPGLMCDVESYIYMPLLEEMGYMPTEKYASGVELRAYAESVAEKFDFKNKAFWGAKISKMEWSEGEKEWKVGISRKEGDGNVRSISVKAQFVLYAAGILNKPKLAGIPGFENFKGQTFHTSRWDYECTGGSPEAPKLSNLKDKIVAIIGTGATGVQAVPHLAKWAKELYVFQRTPSAINRRDNKLTDPEYWKNEVASKKGWQRARSDNFNSQISHSLGKDEPDLVNDEWSKQPTYNALIGGPNNVTYETVGAFVADFYAKDLPHQERVRARVEEIIKDIDTAEKLKPWYPAWCKRPCFHDEYLPTFNRENVTLVDTDGKGVEQLTEKGILFNGKEYEIDVLIFSTGFISPADGSPASRAGVEIIGKNGLSFDQKWANGVGTLHGITSHDFPNFFLPGPNQMGPAANFTCVLDTFATHAAYIISAASKQHPGATIAIEPSKEAEEEWTGRIMAGAMCCAAISGCTPSYFNKEGESDRPLSQEKMMILARSVPFMGGMQAYLEVIEAWRAEGGLKGLEVSA